MRAVPPLLESALRYGERLKTHGLNLLSAPGNDAVATSALAATPGAGPDNVLLGFYGLAA